MSLSLGNIVNFLNPAAPKGTIGSAEDWVRRRRVADDLRAPQPAAWCRSVTEEAESFFHDSQTESFGEFPELRNVRWTVASASQLFFLSGARVLGVEGTVISPDNRVFREFTHPPGQSWLDHSCFKRRRIPAVQRLKGWYATVAYPASMHYFHWILESLPRMKMLQQYIGILDGIIVPGPIAPFHRESLAALGVPPEKLVPLGPNSHFQVDRLFVPQYFSFYNPPSWLHQWYKSTFIDSGIDKTNRPGSNKIYVSRKDANVRKTRNEADVIAHLKSRGFNIVTLSELTFRDQARLFFDADIIVAPHGAGLANLVFCQPGTRVLEICSPNWMPPCYFVLANLAAASHSYMLAERCSTDAPATNPQLADVTVSLETLSRHVDQLLANPAG